MAYPAYLRRKAEQIRRHEKLSLDEIAERLALPRTTVYYWISGIPLGRARRENGHPGNVGMQAKHRRIRERAYELGRREFRDLAEDATFRDFVVLYIAEGYKRNRNRVSISNSDPAVLWVAVRQIRRFSKREVGCSLQFHADQDPEQLRDFWSQQLAVDPGRISLQRKSNSSRLAQRKWRCRYGVLSVGVNDTSLRARLQGWIDSLKCQWLDS